MFSIYATNTGNCTRCRRQALPARHAIDRPDVYSHWGSMGTVRLLRGPELFYLISVANPEVDTLVLAFERYKR
jgi:hypothetical protein